MEECEVHFCDVTLKTSTLADVEPGNKSGTASEGGKVFQSTVFERIGSMDDWLTQIETSCPTFAVAKPTFVT